MIFRKATIEDIDEVAYIFSEIHKAEAAGEFTTGWLKDVYPVRATAEAALERGDLFVMEDEGEIRAAAVINQIQVDVYEGAPWKHDAPAEEVCVLHTLVVLPSLNRKGYGRKFVEFFESYAAENGMSELRIDTNEKNRAARQLYASMGYEEVTIVPTVFNGIPGVNLVLIEKHL